MYLVKALKVVRFPTSPGQLAVDWAVNQHRIVDDGLLQQIDDHGDVFEVVEGPDAVAVVKATAALLDTLSMPMLQALTLPEGAAFSIGDWYLLLGDGAPAASAQAAVLMASAGANNDLTFTAVGYGDAGNDLSVAIVQADTANAALAVTITGTQGGGDWLATITLPTDGDAVAVAKTANQVKTAWDATAAAVAVATVAVEGTGAGNVAAHAAADFAGGDGVGVGFAGTGSEYTDLTTPGKYLNTGTKEQPAWTELTQAA